MFSKYTIAMIGLGVVAVIVSVLESRFAKECPLCGGTLGVVHTKIRCFAGVFVCLYSFLFYYFFTNRIVDVVVSIAMVVMYVSILIFRKVAVRYDCKIDRCSFVEDGSGALVKVDSW